MLRRRRERADAAADGPGVGAKRRQIALPSLFWRLMLLMLTVGVVASRCFPGMIETFWFRD
eukprot:gene29993-57772_t